MTMSPSLIDRAQNRPDVEGRLRQLRRQHLMEQGNDVYIPPQAKAGLQASDESRFQLMDKVKEFLNSDQEVFLLLGDPGSGKSTFSRALDRDLWNAYKKDGDIPLHINLPAIDKPEHDMIAKQLRKMELTEPQIRELKMHRKFVLMCDGYDESQQTHNLYTANRLNEPGEWTAKMIISCRTEYLGIDYRDRFQPGDRNHQSKSTQFQEAVMTPFSESQIDDYIHEYVSIHQPLWEAKDYKQALDLIPSLKELVKNPFLMTLSLEVMPRMMDPGEHLSVTHVTKIKLYDHFIEHWLERGKKRLGEKKLTPQSRAAFESLIDEGFTRNGIDFLKKLAVAVYKEQDGQPIVEYSRYKDEHSWKSEFFSRDDEKQLLREACPLTRNGNQYRFIHRSLLEYGLALAVFDPQDWRRRATLAPSLGRRESASSVSSMEISDTDDKEIRTIEQRPDRRSPLVWRSFVNEYSLVQFLEERVQQEPVFKQQLFDYIEFSKADKKWRTAAANAITILVRAGVEFRSADLQGIQISGADLSYGMFDSANLQGADLRKVNLSNVWLRGSDLSRAQMRDVQFGELPFLKYDCEVSSCAYSPDGTSFTVALSDGNIHMYATSNWEMTRMLSGHGQRVDSVAYLPNGDRIVSGSEDSTVRIWDAATGDCLYIFIGHTGGVKSVTYSPQGNVVASRDGGTVRLWDLEAGDCRSIISGCGSIGDMAFSPRGVTLAFGSDDCRVRLWNVASREFSKILIGHTYSISAIAFSAQGGLLISSQEYSDFVRVWEVASGACCRIIRAYGSPVVSPKGNQVALYGDWSDKGTELWDIETGTCIRRLSSHKKTTYSVAYSPQGDQIVSGDNDKAVRLWDVETGECRQTMVGHTSRVMKILFSPKGDYIASAGEDKTVRLWSVGSGVSRKFSIHHSGAVISLKYSSKRNQVASSSQDSTIRLWDAETGAHGRTLTGHSGHVYQILYSPQEDRLLSCSSDSTLRVWDVESGACRYILSGHTNAVVDLAISPRGDQIASASWDNTVRLWNVNTGECQHILIGHNVSVWVVTYSPQGDQVASADMNGTVRLWSVETGACRALTGHSDLTRKVVYSPDGKQIASVGNDKTVRLWDVETGLCTHIFVGHQDEITRVVYSPQRGQVASSCWDKTIRLWDAESGECLHTLVGHEQLIDAIAYSPRGNLLVSWSDAEEVRLWDAETGDCYWNLKHDGSTPSGGISLTDLLVWMTSDVDSFITGDGSGSVRVWDVIKDGDQYRVNMRWRSANGQLTVKDASVQNVRGLSDLDKRLLKQRGATGEPSVRLRDASKKMMTMASVVSKLKSSSSGADALNQSPSSSAISLARHSGKQPEQATDPETQGHAKTS